MRFPTLITLLAASVISVLASSDVANSNVENAVLQRDGGQRCTHVGQDCSSTHKCPTYCVSEALR
jgi:hypothetical protein